MFGRYLKSCNLLFPWVFRQHIDPRLADSRPQGGQCFRGMMAHIADRRTENQAQYTDTGWNPRCAKQFLSPESTFSTATLSRCPYSALYNPTCTSISICEHVNVRQPGSHTVVKVTPICPRGVMNLSVSFNCISFFLFLLPMKPLCLFCLLHWRDVATVTSAVGSCGCVHSHTARSFSGSLLLQMLLHVHKDRKD